MRFFLLHIKNPPVSNQQRRCKCSYANNFSFNHVLNYNPVLECGSEDSNSMCAEAELKKGKTIAPDRKRRFAGESSIKKDKS